LAESGTPIRCPEKAVKIIKSMILFVLFPLLASGCLYANYKAPYDKVIDETSIGNKTGRASIHVVMWSVSWGDSGVNAAARDGGITRITHMDRELLQIFFGVYTRHTTIVYGN
jgi:hypothetical protein